MFGSVSLAEVHEGGAALRDLVGRLEPDLVPLPEAPAMWLAFDVVERLAASAKTLLATRVDESGVWQSAGDRSAPEYLARKSGSSLGAARSSLETSNRAPSAKGMCHHELSPRPPSGLICTGAATKFVVRP